MKKIYSLIAVAVVAITAMWAANTTASTEVVKTWNFSEWTAGDITETTTIDGLTVYATDSKKVSIDGNKKTINDVEYTQRLKFGGTIGWDGNAPANRALSFVVNGPATIEIALTSGKSGEDRILNVYANDKNNLVGEITAAGDAVTVETLEFTGEGENTIILGSANSGINLYYIKVITTPAQSGDDEGEPGTGDGSDDDNIGLNDPTDEVTFDFTAETFDMTVLSGNTQEYNPDPTVIDYKDITLTLNGHTRMWQATNGTELRFYAGSNFNVAAPEGFLISKIEMTGQTSNTNFAAEGYNNGTWEGEAPAQNVTIACIKSKDNAAIKTIKVTLVEDPAAQEELPEIDSFNPLSDAEDGAEFKVGMDVTVVLANEALSIVYDGVSYQGVIFGYPLSVEAGDVVKAGWNAMYESGVLFATSEITVDGTAALPEPTPIENVENIPNWQYVHFDNVIVPSNGVDDYYFPMCEAAFDDGSLSFMMENMLGLDITAGDYAVDGFWYVNYALDEDPVQSFIPTAVTPSAESIDNFNALLGGDIEQGTEVEISCNATVALAIPVMMMYLIYDGQTYYPLATEQEFAVGDIIAGGWNAYVIDNGVYTEETLDVIGKGEVPEPTHVEFADLAYTMSMPYQLITIEGVEMEEFTAGDDVIMVGEYIFMNAFDLSKDAGTYDVTGIWYEMMGTKVFIITSITENSTSINGIMIDANENAEYFNLNGVKVQNPTAGQVYIRVINGKATKVVK